MQDVIERMRASRMPLVRFPGGFWTLANTPLKGTLTCGDVPEWSVAAGTVRAMEKRNLLVRLNAESEAWSDSYRLAEPVSEACDGGLYYSGYTREGGPLWFYRMNGRDAIGNETAVPCCQVRTPCVLHADGGPCACAYCGFRTLDPVGTFLKRCPSCGKPEQANSDLPCIFDCDEDDHCDHPRVPDAR